MKKKTNIILIIILSMLLLIEIILIKLDYLEVIDNYVYSIINQFITPTNTTIFKFFSFFGSETFIIIICLLALLLAKKKSRGVGFVFIILLSILLNQGLKLLVGRPRPNINPLVIETSYSFPSGHTMIISTMVGLFIFYLWKSQKGSKIQKISITTVLSIIALLIMLSRIYLGVHYFSDIIGGIITTLLLLSIVYYYYTFKYKIPYFPKKIK